MTEEPPLHKNKWPLYFTWKCSSVAVLNKRGMWFYLLAQLEKRNIFIFWVRIQNILKNSILNYHFLICFIYWQKYIMFLSFSWSYFFFKETYQFWGVMNLFIVITFLTFKKLFFKEDFCESGPLCPKRVSSL